MKRTISPSIAIFLGITSFTSQATLLNIINPSFEDDPNTNNEFFFGNPNGWSLIDPGGIVGGLDLQGTLTATGSPFFDSGAPDGDNVALLFIGDSQGTTEFGLAQILANTLAADTRYQLSVEVGNIQSGTAQSDTFFNLDGFPGYRIDLLAGGVVLATTTAGINAPIAEGAFANVTLEHVSGAAPTQLGQALEIRLVNLNLTDANFTGADLEVDFDLVQLDATAVPQSVPSPASLSLMLLGIGLLTGYRRSRRHQPLVGYMAAWRRGENVALQDPGTLGNCLQVTLHRPIPIQNSSNSHPI